MGRDIEIRSSNVQLKPITELIRVIDTVLDLRFVTSVQFFHTFYFP